MFITTTSFGALKSEGKTKLTLNAKESKAQITVEEGFHFNIQAPTFLEKNNEKQKPSLLTEKKLEFKWIGPIKNGSKINYYVCDDAKTVCEPHTDLLSENQSESVKAFSPKPPPATLIKDKDGFILNNLDAALTEAQRKKQLLLIDFTASWCPPCIRLTHETFNTSKFKKFSSQITLVKIDVDQEENQSLLEKYSIHAFPSLVIINNQGIEMDRILDFIPVDPLVQKLSSLIHSKSPSIQELNQKALHGDKSAALKMAKNAFLSLQMKECIEWYQRAEQKPIEYYMCLIAQAEEASAEDQIATYKKSIEAFPHAFYSIEWRLELAKLILKDKTKETEYQNLLSEAEKNIQKWLDSTQLINASYKNNELLELKDLVIPELYYYWGTILETKNLKVESAKKFNLAVQKTMELKPTVEKPTIIIYLVRYLKKINQTENALQWLQKLEKVYPNEYTYLQRQATALTEINDYNRALPIAERAYQLSYGRNKLSTGLQLATIKKELHQKDKAKTLLKELQTSSIVQMKNNSKYLEKINKALKEME